VGVSTGRTFSAHLRRTISLCVLERDLATPGTPATVLWGHSGSAQREIRATVASLPMKPDRRRVDVTTM
jgi:vanillate/3-O-methylgallate O-demethylase